MNNLPKKNVVIDTNVALVANRKAIHADEDCIDTCIQVIEGIRDRCCVVVDNQWAIMREYEGQLNSSGQPGVGDAFLKWLLTHLWNPSYCLQVEITPHAVREFQEFPDDPALGGFDRSDRKFVAVARAAGLDSPPTILNASDTDWWDHRAALNAHGINITFLCPQLMPPEGR